VSAVGLDKLRRHPVLVDYTADMSDYTEMSGYYDLIIDVRYYDYA
jgi:hypothetical protein